MDSNLKPAFYAIIPAHVRYCKDLEPNAKLLYGEITALCQQEGYCWATNQYLADLYEVNISTIKRWITSLEDNKFIFIDHVKNGFQDQRRIWISEEIKKHFTEAQKRATPSSKMSHPQLKNEPHNNTSNNTNKKKEINKEKESVAIAPAAAQLFDFLFEEFRKKDSGRKLPTGKQKDDWLKVLTDLTEGRTIENIKRVLLYGLNHEFYSGQMTTSKKLKEYFERIAMAFAAPRKSQVSHSAEDNKQFAIQQAKELLQKCKDKNVIIDILNKHVEIRSNNGNFQPLCIEYTSHGFEDQFLNALRKFGII